MAFLSHRTIMLLGPNFKENTDPYSLAHVLNLFNFSSNIVLDTKRINLLSVKAGRGNLMEVTQNRQSWRSFGHSRVSFPNLKNAIESIDDCKSREEGIR